MAFAIAFVGASYPIADSNFVRVDDTHYVLDVGASVTPDYQNLKEVALFLTSPSSLPDPHLALGLYISLGGQDWQFRGYVSTDHPTEVMPLKWPIVAGHLTVGPGTIQLGVSIESLAELRQKEGSRLAGKNEYAQRVAQHLYNFMLSFSSGIGNQVVLPEDCFQRWKQKFDQMFAKDPNFLLNSGDKSHSLVAP